VICFFVFEFKNRDLAPTHAQEEMELFRVEVTGLGRFGFDCDDAREIRYCNSLSLAIL
jgi:hypothetical protein